MRQVTSIRAMQRLARRWKAAGSAVGLVPTMGYLHAGHLSLVSRARRCVGARGRVVVSIYVNPTQFGPHEDLARYPRDLERDLQRCRQAGTDVVFVPTDQEMYPAVTAPGEGFSTWITEEGLTRVMEGASRPTHFRGVTTVVGKLFNLVQPDVAVFGAKDCQQAAVIQRMVRDLNFPIKIVVAPTLRAPDGLAMSSRNAYLTAAERAQAPVLWQAMLRAKAAVRRAGGGLPGRELRRRLVAFIQRQPAARVDYLEFFDPATLAPVDVVGPGTHLALAVFMGKTRLIDNTRL